MPTTNGFLFHRITADRDKDGEIVVHLNFAGGGCNIMHLTDKEAGMLVAALGRVPASGQEQETGK
jgi:hypothetical protein